MEADRNRPGPWNNDVEVFRAAAGREPERLATFERAGVPTVARLRDGRLIAAFQHFPQDDERNFDRVAVCYSRDEGRTWTRPQAIMVEGQDEGQTRPFDPTLVPLPDGRVRLYFTSNRSPDFRRSTPQIFSAISTDGLRYTFEPGVRFGVEGRVAIDCAVTQHEGLFHLIVPDNGTAEDFRPGPGQGAQPPGGNGYHAVSRDGLHFERVADVKLASSRDRWLGNLLSDGGRMLFFGTGPGPWPVASRDGTTWEPASPSTRISGADPGAVKLRDGSWLLLATGAPRTGTPGAGQREDGAGQPPAPRMGPGGAPSQPNGLHVHQVVSASSPDGLTWTRDEGVRVAGVSVPCAINDGDRRVLLYFVRPPDQPGQPETVACAVSTNGLRFEAAPDFRIEGLSTLKAVDPSILRDGDGKFRLYYLASDHRGDPARGANPHRIHCAVSDDGIRFRETGSVFSYDDLVDPDVFRFNGRWFMYVFAGRGTVIATSTDGRQFRHLRDMTPRDWGTTAAVPLPDGRLRLYGFEQRVPSGNAVRSFLSSNGVDWSVEPGVRLQAAAGEQITDPYVIRWRDGWKMYYKTSPALLRGAPPPGGDRPAPQLRHRNAEMTP